MVSERWRQRIQSARNEVYALYRACRDERVPWYAKVVAGAVVAYAVSPVDLIPDFIPVLGYLDDALIVPLGVLLVRRMVPRDVLDEHRAAASERLAAAPLFTWVGAALTVALWLVTAAALAAVYRSVR
ncbi:MAG: DUF1232 domain-containing protein [Dehalococcoidia bacterium]|nr:DUF1232 domain-containing protein [Dehalococcoidia bacterium]